MRLLVILALIAVAFPSIASTRCEKMEFAELQSKTRKQLEWRYCDTLMDAGRADEAFRAALEFRSKFSRIGAARQAAAQDAEVEREKDNAALCRHEALRSYEQLGKRFKVSALPNCEKVMGPGVWKPEWDIGK